MEEIATTSAITRPTRWREGVNPVLKRMTTCAKRGLAPFPNDDDARKTGSPSLRELRTQTAPPIRTHCISGCNVPVSWEFQLSDVAPFPTTGCNCSKRDCHVSTQKLFGCTQDRIMFRVQDRARTSHSRGAADTFMQPFDKRLTRWSSLQIEAVCPSGVENCPCRMQ
jgi:hypothetical protein